MTTATDISRRPAVLDLRPAPSPAPDTAPRNVFVSAALGLAALPTRRHRIAVAVFKALALTVAALIFLSLNNIDLASRLIGIYFAAALIYRIDSQRTFLVALIFLIMVAVWSAFGSTAPAENYAVYAFYFLVIGLFTAVRELIH